MKFNRKDRVYIVYMLFEKDDSLVYIGKTSIKQLHDRLRVHEYEKSFEYFSFEIIGPSAKDALDEERRLIKKLNPPLNKIHRTNLRPDVKSTIKQERERGAAFSSALSSHLADSCITQREFAKMMGVTEGMISNYLAGRREPGLKLIERIAQALDAKLEYTPGMGWRLEHC